MTHQYQNPNANITGLLVRAVENFVALHALGYSNTIARQVNLYPTQLQTLAYSIGRAFTDVAVHHDYLPVAEQVSYHALPSSGPTVMRKGFWVMREIVVNTCSLALIHLIDKKLPADVPRQTRLNAFTGVWKVSDEILFYIMNGKLQMSNSDFLSTALEIGSSYVALTVALDYNLSLTDKVVAGSVAKLVADGFLMMFGHQPQYIRATMNDPNNIF